MKPEIIVALDDINFVDARMLASKLASSIWGVKFNDFLVRHGVGMIYEFKREVNVVADLKLFDIPTTMQNTLRHLDSAGAKIATVHLSAGAEALKALKKGACPNIQLFGVTTLTSMSDDEVMKVYNAQRPIAVNQLMLIAREAGMDGVVCSADNVALAKKLGLRTLVPGVRLPDMSVVGDDQVHKATEIPDCNYIVVGRPITKAVNPVAAAERIKALIEEREAAVV